MMLAIPSAFPKGPGRSLSVRLVQQVPLRTRKIDMLLLADIVLFIMVCQWTAFAGHSGHGIKVDSATAHFATITIGAGAGRTIPSTFMGLSHEWADLRPMMGYSGIGVNTIYRQLLKNLLAYGAGPMDIRVGGNSTDTTGIPSGDRVKPLSELAGAISTRFTLGVNLGGRNLSLAAAQTRFYLSEMPKGSVVAIELGNEPDHYPKRGMRSTSYRPEDYLSEFDQWKNTLQPLLPAGVRFEGPSLASPEFLPNVRSFVSREGASLSAFSQHYYAGGPGSHPTDDYLLKPAVATRGPLSVAPAVAIAHAYGVPFRMGEMNSLGNEGVHGISDAFSSALWAIDTMFEYANVGVDGVNWETSSGNFYCAFQFTNNTINGKTTYALKSVAPLYYGLLFFQAATGHQAKFLPVTLNTQANLKAWATVDSAGVAHLVIINNDKASMGTVSVALPGFRHAQVLRLLAPSYTATTGVTFGGQTFDGSPDGTVQGRPASEAFESTNGAFQIPISATSAALVTLTR